ncbi:MAG: methyltransferase domain-containing protein [Candidatus Omnitrophica bacterium]|nr:methyltransferase domain-containing protein [Candidatus Omnitrophota bacterium]
MKPTLAQVLTCPACQGRFRLKVFSSADNEVKEGILVCQGCSAAYPIIEAIPRMLEPEFLYLLVSGFEEFLKKYRQELQAQVGSAAFKHISQAPADYRKKVKKITAGFKYEWSKHSSILPTHENEFLHVLGDCLKKQDFAGKIVLDAGCGQGRFAYFANKYGASEIYCLDLSEAVVVAKKNLKDIPNIHIIQGDIYNLPFGRLFDIIYSIGVIHHLPDPEKGFHGLIDKLKKGGTVFVWVYGYSSVVPALKAVRKISLRLPIGLMWFLSTIPAAGLYLINLFYRAIRKVGFLKAVAERVPFNMYNDRTFHNTVTVSFDHLTTSIANFYRKEELEEWLKRSTLSEWRLSERYPGRSGSSWRLLGKV